MKSTCTSLARPSLGCLCMEQDQITSMSASTSWLTLRPFKSPSFFTSPNTPMAVDNLPPCISYLRPPRRGTWSLLSESTKVWFWRLLMSINWYVYTDLSIILSNYYYWLVINIDNVHEKSIVDLSWNVYYFYFCFINCNYSYYIALVVPNSDSQRSKQTSEDGWECECEHVNTQHRFPVLCQWRVAGTW